MPWALVDFMWRRKHASNLFGGLLETLRGVSFSSVSRNAPYLTEVIEDREPSQSDVSLNINEHDNEEEEQHQQQHIPVLRSFEQTEQPEEAFIIINTRSRRPRRSS
jgi:hypothetical protein